MAKTIKIQSTKNGFKVVKVKTVANEKYIIADETGKPLNKLKFVQKNKNLEIYTDVNGKEQQVAILEDYYAPDMNASVVGLSQTSEELAYAYNANDGWSYLELPESAFGFATPLLGLGAVAVVPGIAIANNDKSSEATGNDNNNNSSTDTAQASILAQIGNEGDNPDSVNSVVTAIQLASLSGITGVINANEDAYQDYIDANPDSFSSPATLAEVQAMITAVNITPTTAISSYADNVGAITNANSTATSTDDTTPGFNVGAMPADANSIVLYVNGVEVASTYNSTTGTLTPNTPLTEGTYSITYAYKDINGNTSAQSPAFSLSVDTPPVAPTTAISSYADNVGTITNANSTATSTDDTTPGFNVGAIPADASSIVLYVNGVEVASTYNSTTGTLTPNTPLTEGTYSITYAYKDINGNTSTQSPAFSLSVDTPPVAPTTAISSYADNVGTITNANSTATTTDDTTPGFNVGAIPADASSIVLYVNGVEVIATYNSTAQTLTPNTPLGQGTYSITYAYKDANGNTSAQSPAFSLTTDITPPNFPVINAQSPQVKLEGTGVTNGADEYPQITAVGSSGEYVVTFTGKDSNGDNSIFVQKFNADGTIQGSQVMLEATGVTNGSDQRPQITAVGSAGEYVVTYYGIDSNGDESIFVQKFNADGTIQGTQVKLEATGVTNGGDYDPQITAVGTAGEYVVTYHGLDSNGDYSIFVQKFNADGTIQGSQVMLEATGVTNRNDSYPQITAVGSAGEYVVTFTGIDSNGDNSIFVQKFNADGTIQGSQVMLEATGVTNKADTYTQIAAVGNAGEYVVSYRGTESSGYATIFVQKFNADGTVQGSQVRLQATGVTNQDNYVSQIAAVGNAGEYVVVFSGTENGLEYSVFVQKFNADGTIQGSQVKLEATDVTNGNDLREQIIAVGNAGEYVVTYQGRDSNGDNSIFVQRFNADGTIQGSQVKLEATGVTNGSDQGPQITAVGSEGEYVITYYGIDSNGDNSIFVQKFNADGTPENLVEAVTVAENTLNTTVVFDANATDNGGANDVGIIYSISGGVDANKFTIDSASGEVRFITSPDYEIPTDVGGNNVYDIIVKATDSSGNSTDKNVAINVTNIIEPLPTPTTAISSYADNVGAITNANSTATSTDDTTPGFNVGAMPADASSIVLYVNGVEVASTYNSTAQTLTPNTPLVEGTYSITYAYKDINGNTSAQSPAFSLTTDITPPNFPVVNIQSPQVKLEGTGVTNGSDRYPQITAVGNAGEYVVTYTGLDNNGDSSIFVQKFNTDGTIQGSQVMLEATGVTNGTEQSHQITAVGNAGEYVVTYQGTDSNGDQSIFVQKFNADGTIQGNQVKIEATGVTNGSDQYPQITALGTTGEYVVTYQGIDSTGDNSIFVQKFNANGTIQGSQVMLEATGVINGADQYPQITAVGNAGEYVVTYSGIDNNGDYSIFVQKFNANGTIQGSQVIIEATGVTNGSDESPQSTSVGTGGEYVVTYSGVDSNGDYSIFVQKFNADGTIQGSQVMLEATGVTNGDDSTPQIKAVGDSGEYVVTFTGLDSNGDYSIFVQKFNADGTVQGSQVMLEATGVINGNDAIAQIKAVGNAGEYVVTYHGRDTNGDNSIFVQKFNADGTIQGSQVMLEATGVTNRTDALSQIIAVGTAGEYVVTYMGTDSNGDDSIFVQKFNADGTPANLVEGVSVAENTATTAVVFDANATDNGAANDVGITYSISGGVDANKFTIDSVSGEVRFVASPDYEIPTDVGGNNVYDIIVRATDIAGNSTDKNVAINVTNIVELLPTPTTAISSYADNVGAITNANSTATSTDDTTPGFNVGAMPADASSIVLYVDGVEVASTYNSINGTLTPNTTLGGGTYSITYAYEDANGNTSAQSPAFSLTIDRIAPIFPVVNLQGSQVKLEATGVTNGADYNPQITAVGNFGEYVVTYFGIDSNGDNSIFVQKFNANGTIQGSQVMLEATGVTNGGDQYSEITAVGNTGEYVVTYYGIDSNGDNSIFVQKFNADGTIQGSQVMLEATGVTNGIDSTPQITAVRTAGEYVVTYHGIDSNGDNSIFVQKFNANGTIQGSQVKLEGVGVINGTDQYPQITAVGNTGEYVVTYRGIDNNGDYSIFVQKFNADGTIQGSQVMLEAIGVTNGNDFRPQITAVGTAGEYVVTYYGIDSNGDNSIFVQKFNADGTIQGSQVMLEATGVTNGADINSEITAVGTAGEYVVTYHGIDSNGDNSIFVQKFNADGTTQGSQVMLEATGVTNGSDANPQIKAVGNTGEYVVTYYGIDSNGDNSIFVQKFNANGTIQGSQVMLEATGVTNGADGNPQIKAVGNSGEYVVTFTGVDSNGDYSIFVQKFNADGTPVEAVTVAENTPNTTVIFDANATDNGGANDVGITYSISGGADANKFTINSASGEVKFIASPDYENPTDVGANNVYDIVLRATNSAGNSTDKNVAVTVTNIVELPRLNIAMTSLHSNPVPRKLEPMEIAGNDRYSQITTFNDGSYVVVWSGKNLDDDYDIFVQKFNADGTTTGNNMATLEGHRDGTTLIPQTTSLIDGSYVVIYNGLDSNGDDSIFVQKFNADGTTVGNDMVKLEGVSGGQDESSQITSLNDGSYVVTWQGNVNGDYSIFVQKFNADGTIVGNDMVILEGVLGENDSIPQITSLNDGSYVVTWNATDSIFVQKFNADGTIVGNDMVMLEGITGQVDYSPQITSLSNGAFVVTWHGMDTNGVNSIFVQKFNSNGTTIGNNPVTLEGSLGGVDESAQITSLSDGAYVVTWKGVDTNGNTSIFVQKFNADGTINGNNPVSFNGDLYEFPQITSLSDGDYVVTWEGKDSSGTKSIFVQKFNADGTTAGNSTVLEGIVNGQDHKPQIGSLSNGGFVVTWEGIDETGDYSIFLQQFDANGIPVNETSNNDTLKITSTIFFNDFDTIDYYVVEYSEGTLTVDGTTYATGSTVAQSTWEAAVANGTIFLSNVNSNTYNLTLSTRVTDTETGTMIRVTDTIMGIGMISPMMLDLDGNGVNTSSFDNGVIFDVNADEKTEQTGWSDGKDGFLVLDLNKDGIINDGSELFGEGTTLSDGSKAKDAFEALKQYDENHDNIIDSNDSIFTSLQIWVDKNIDGKTNSGELYKLEDLNVKSLDLNSQNISSVDNGNIQGLVSSWKDTNDNSYKMVDVWFKTQEVSQNTISDASAWTTSTVSEVEVNTQTYVAYATTQIVIDEESKSQNII